MTERDIPEVMGTLGEIEKLCDGDFVYRDTAELECGEF